MLAARDQENLVHGHLAAAACKPLNQGTRQLPPKTPGKVPKTPFKLPLNDENAGGLGPGKGGGKAFGKGNENIMTGAKKGGLGDKITTPMGPRTRAPLGMKTTNAKAKAFQTPVPPPADNNPGKSGQKSVSARKAKPKVSHAEMTKLEVLGDKDELAEPEIEYMPPRPKDLPDLPDDHVELDLSMFENGGLMRGALDYFYTRKEEDGLSHLEREDQRRKKIWDREDRKIEAKLLRDVESVPIPCTHYPDCPGDLCKDTIEARKIAEEQYRKTIAAIDAEDESRPMKPASSDGPSALKSKAAAAVLSQPKTSTYRPKVASKSGAPAAKPRFNTSLVSRPKQAPALNTSSSMRHNAAVAASKSTVGYAKGRAVVTNLRKAGLPDRDPKTKENEVPDESLCPAEYIERYGEPKVGSDMWFLCKQTGCFDKEKPSLEEMFVGSRHKSLDELLREDAEEDFQLTF